MKLEPVRRDLLPKKDRNKQHCQGHLLRELRYHSTCVSGSTSNQQSTTNILLKLRRKWPNCLDMIVLFFEMKTEQPNGQFEDGWITCKKKEDTKEEIPVLLGSSLCRDFSIPWSSSRPFRRKTHQSCIARQRVVTERRLRAHLSRWKLPRYALGRSIWIDSGWQERETCGVLWGCIGRDTKTQCIGVIWGLLRARGCSSIRHDQTLSSFTTFYMRCASERWWSGSQEKNCTAKRNKLLFYHKEWYFKPNLHYGRQDTTSSDARTSFDHSGEHRETCGGGTYKATFRGEIDLVPKDCPTRPSKSKITPARMQSKSWCISSRRTRIEKRCKPTWTKFTRSIRSASSRRKWSPAWETWSISRSVRSFPKYSATTVWHTGRKGLYIVFAEHACDLQTRFENWIKIALMICRFQTAWWRKAHGNTERQIIYHAAHVSAQKRQRKMVTNPYLTGSCIALVIENHKSTSDGTKNIAHATMRSRPKITPVSLQRQSATDVKMLRCLYSTVQVRTARWTNVKTTTKPSKSKSHHTKRLAKVTQDSIPVNNFDNDQVNHSLGTMKELRECRLQNWMEMVSLTVIFLSIPVSRCFAYRQWRYLCRRRGV